MESECPASSTPSELPFVLLNTNEVRGVYGLHPIYQTSDLGYDASLMRGNLSRSVVRATTESQPTSKGNYAAGLIATSLRKEAKANTRNFRQLKLILALPLELMFEVCYWH